MKISERVAAINELEKVETPWEVKRIFGEVILFGSQVSVVGDDCRDYADVDDMRKAIAWLAEQFGGTVKWTKPKPAAKQEQV
jgi:hypothetical protein